MGLFKKARQRRSEKKALVAMYGKERGTKMAKQSSVIKSHKGR